MLGQVVRVPVPKEVPMQLPHPSLAPLLLGCLAVPASGQASPLKDPTFYPVGDYPTGMDVGDLDGDGDPDVVVANELSHDLSLLFNRGNGSFRPELRLSGAEESIRDVAIGDVNGDTYPDLVASRRLGSSSMTVFLGDGRGSFVEAGSFGPQQHSSTVVLADLDGDLDLDAAVSKIEFGNDTPQASVFLNDGTGNFLGPTQYVFEAGQDAYMSHLAAADVDGNGSIDLVGTAFPVFGSVALLLNAGDGTFGAAISLDHLGASNPVGLTVADLDGDRDVDLAVLDAPSGRNKRVLVARNDGRGGFSSAEVYPIGGSTGSALANRALAAGDLDGDGRVDLAVSGALLLNTGPGFAPLPLETRRFAGALADLDADGDLDLLMTGNGSSSDGRLSVHKSLAAGRPEAALRDFEY